MLNLLPTELIQEIADQLTSRNDIYCLLMTCKDLSTILQPHMNKAAKKLLDAAAAKNLPLIHYAAFEDSYPIAKLALKLDPDCINNAISIYGTPLLIASWKTYPSMVDFLLSHGADPNARNPNEPMSETPLSRALRNIVAPRDITQQLMSQPSTNNQSNVIQQLLDGGANPNLSGHNSLNALLEAASKGIPKLITSIMDTGLIDIDIRSPNGGTALHIAAASKAPNAPGVIEELLRYEIDIDAINDHDQTALFTSCSRENTELLIQHGIDVNHVGEEGQTVFHYRARGPHHRYATRRVLEILFCTDCADLTILDHMGRSALDYAVYTQNVGMMKLLTDYELMGRECFNHSANVEG